MSGANMHVDADWVQAHLGDPKVVLVEVEEDSSAYDNGHIQGAVKLDWNNDLQSPALRDLANQAGFEALLSERGIANDDTVILYSGSCWLAVYTYWYFKLYGHHSVKLLEGGRKKWELDSRELVTGAACRPRTAYRVAESPHRAKTAYRVPSTPGSRAAPRAEALTQLLRDGVAGPAGRAVWAVAARVLALLAAAVNNREDDASATALRAVTAGHGIDGAKEQDAASSTGFGPVIYGPHQHNESSG